MLNEIARLEILDLEISLRSQDVKFMAAYTKLLSSYTALQADVGLIGLKYDNSVLTYSPMIEPLEVNCWNLYLDEAERINTWKQELLRSYDTSYNLVFAAIKTGSLPEDFEEQLTSISYEMGAAYKSISPPSLSGLLAIKNANHPRYNKSKHTDAVNCAGV